MDLLKLYTTFYGRISRSTWWFGMIALILPSFFVLAGLHLAFKDFFEPLGFPSSNPNPAETLFLLLLVVPQAALATKRFNDRGHATWVAKLFIAISLAVPVAQQAGFFVNPKSTNSFELICLMALGLYGLWVLIDNGFLLGTKGPNAYGPDPLAD